MISRIDEAETVARRLHAPANVIRLQANAVLNVTNAPLPTLS